MKKLRGFGLFQAALLDDRRYLSRSVWRGPLTAHLFDRKVSRETHEHQQPSRNASETRRFQGCVPKLCSITISEPEVRYAAP